MPFYPPSLHLLFVSPFYYPPPPPQTQTHTHTHAREISIVAYYFRQSAAVESRYLLQWPSRFFCLLRCFVFFEHLVQALICFSAVCFPPLFPPLLLCILIILPQTPTPWQQRFCFFFFTFASSFFTYANFSSLGAFFRQVKRKRLPLKLQIFALGNVLHLLNDFKLQICFLCSRTCKILLYYNYIFILKCSF